MGSADDIVEFHSIRELIWPLYIPGVLAWVSRSFVIAVLPIHILELGYSYDDVGFLIGLMGFGSMICNMPTALLLQRYGPKAIVILANFVVFVAAIVCTLAYSFALMGVACFLLGVGESSGILARTTFLGATVKSNLRGRASSTLGGVARIGYMIGPLVAGAVAVYRGPRVVYMIQAVLSAASGIMTQILMPYVREDQDLTKSQKTTTKPASGSMSAVTVIKAHWRILLTVTFFVVCLSILRKSRELLFPLVGHEERMSQDQIGVVVAVSYALDALMFPLAGKLLDSTGRTKTGAFTSMLFTAGILVLEGGGVWSYIAFAVISGIANGLSSGIVITMGGDLAPADCRSQFLAVYRTLGRMADLMAPLIVGLVADHSSLHMAELVVCLVGVIGAAWILGCVRETLESPSKSAEAGAQKPMKMGKVADGGTLGSGGAQKPVKMGKYAELNDDVEAGAVGSGGAEKPMRMAKAAEGSTLGIGDSQKPLKINKYAELSNDAEAGTLDSGDLQKPMTMGRYAEPSDDEDAAVENEKQGVESEALCLKEPSAEINGCSEVQLKLLDPDHNSQNFACDVEEEEERGLAVDVNRSALN